MIRPVVLKSENRLIFWHTNPGGEGDNNYKETKIDYHSEGGKREALRFGERK